MKNNTKIYNRFKGFTLEDCDCRYCLYYGGRRKGKVNCLADECVCAEEIRQATGGYMLSVNDALSYDRDAIGIGRKGTIDRPYILKAPFWTVDTLFYAIPREKVDLNYAFDIFQNIDWKKKDESTGVPSLSKTAINDIDVLAPKHDEQQIIGQFFAAIDNLITLHQRKPFLMKWRTYARL